MITKKFRGIRPDDLHGRMGLRNPERGFRTEMYFSTIPGEVAGMCSCHFKQNKLDGRPTVPVYQNIDIINASLLQYGGKKILPNELYWTSTEHNKMVAIAIQSSYHAFIQKSESLLVVAMAEF